MIFVYVVLAILFFIFFTASFGSPESIKRRVNATLRSYAMNWYYINGYERLLHHTVFDGVVLNQSVWDDVWRQVCREPHKYFKVNQLFGTVSYKRKEFEELLRREADFFLERTAF